MKLPNARFKRIVADAVLVSLDLLVVNDRAEVLVGRCRNRPAKGFLFVPGGRIQKGESLAAALERISSAEIGVTLERQDARLYGIYDHFYADDAFGETGTGTQYVVIACLFGIPSFVPQAHDDQHDELRMVPIEELVKHPEAHPYTRNYFSDDPSNLFLRAHPFSDASILSSRPGTGFGL